MSKSSQEPVNIPGLNKALLRIKELMDERGFTQYRLSKTSGIPYSSINSLFSKNNNPSISTLEKICAGLGITLSEFFADYESNTNPRKNREVFTKDERMLIEIYREIPNNQRSLALNIFKQLKNN